MLDTRFHRVLCAVVDSYITNPDPVGSRFVTKKYSFNLSPATVRNIMADLEELGYLLQPHTSAGRIPTDKAYRLYVDTLLKDAGSDAMYVCGLESRLESIKNDIHALLEEVSKTLSKLSHYLGVALPLKPDRSIMSRVSLFRYKENQIAVALLTNEGIVKNKIIRVDTDLTQRDLNSIAEYLNAEFSGYTMDEIRYILLKELTIDKMLCDTLISRAMNILQEAFYFNYNTVFISGLSEVLGLPDFSDLSRIKALSRAIEDKHLMIKLLDTLFEHDGVRVVIGDENHVAEMKNLSMVVSTYKEGNRSVGSIGVIGPSRMDYVKAISIVDTTAKYLTRVLSEK